MPQLKIPSSLYTAALSKIRSWTYQEALNIFYSFGNYENLSCQHAISQFNQYLISTIPTHVIDELYNSSEIFFDVIEKTNEISQFENQMPFDQRILLAMYVHSNMKTFTAHKIVNDVFWKLTLPSLQNLLRLDLNKVCTDEVLEVIGKNCKNLEFVNIVSKSCHARTKDRHNALKLQLCVSDEGLSFLSNCKQLKEIQMTSIIRKGCGGRQITNEGVKCLLQSLPKLRRINYTDTGVLFDLIPFDTEKLSLISVIDYHPRAARIPKIELLCPLLTELHLTYAFSTDDYRSDVISALCSSTLKISCLSLTNFPFDDFLKKYFEIKGLFLIVFNFVSSLIQSVNELFRLLGLTCPNLEHMHMHFHLFDRGYISNQCPFSTTLENNIKPFSNLKSLTVKGVYWDSSHILPLVLKNANLIKRIVLGNHSYTGRLDDIFSNILDSNGFLHLENVALLKGANMTFHFLKTFILTCPVLKNLSIENESQSYVELVSQLYKELMLKNIDLKIDAYCAT